MGRFTLSALFLSLALAASADNDRGKTNGLAAKGADVRKNVERLTTEIAWKTDLDAALGQARADGKLVFWMHMLGTLEGVT